MTTVSPCSNTAVAQLFLPLTRVAHANLTSRPMCFVLRPGDLLCQPGDTISVEGYGRYRVLGITWGGPHHDEADLSVEPI